MRVVKANTPAGKHAIAALTNRSDKGMARVDTVVRKILTGVRKRGDVALRSYATKLDGLASDKSIRVPLAEIQRALASLRQNDGEFVRALETAAQNTRSFAEWQKPQAWSR